LRWSDDQIARFQVILPPHPSGAQLDALKKATYSFHKMSNQESRIYGPYRILIVTAKPKDNVASMVKYMAVHDYKEERFRVLNGLTAGEKVKAGQLYKIVASW